MLRLSVEEAKQLLLENNVQNNVIEHCLIVAGYASEIANKIKSKGRDVDVQFVESASILHDIGRAKTHGIMHGVEGARILKDYPEYAKVCERHIGGGIGREEAVSLGLPEMNFLPVTLEEKIVCYADKLVSGERRTTINETLEKFKARLGTKHPTIGRIKRLDEEMNNLMN